MDSKPQNRAQRRAAARQKPSSAQEIPMAQPDRSGPKGKTLFELAEERQALLREGQPFPKVNAVQNESGEFLFSSNPDGDPLGPIGDAFLYGTSLSMLHFTLDVLVYNQYRQDIEWGEIIARVLRVAPVLYLVIYLLHTKTASRFRVLRQLFFFVTAVAAGCYVIYSGNRFGYFAVMKRAPPIGTLWVWSVVEMELLPDVASLVLVGGYMWYMGFKNF